QTWVKRILKFCPVHEIWIERVKFDTQLMQNAEMSGKEYQQGTVQGYTIREYLLEKWNRQERKRLGTSLSYVSKVIHRKDGYKYGFVA
ncbi:RRXRR domain-containing protein, partial [Spirulina sp. CS-785/01]|uniref:RRXRR domain-containing protein n=1 Tax=Spirulina sp. CS-785/01 TaxID=3021716 RepID=UPI00232B653B